MSDLPAARTCYERALQIDPNQAGVLWNLALVLEQQGERNWAEKLYERIPDEAPEACDAIFRLGYLRLLRGRSASTAGQPTARTSPWMASRTWIPDRTGRCTTSRRWIRSPKCAC